MRAAAFCTIVLLLALIVAPPVLEASVLLAALHDAAHVLVFAVIGLLLCLLMTPRGALFASLFAIAAAFAIGTELAQPYFAGAGALELASHGDVGRDLLGTAIGVLAWLAHRRHRPFLYGLAALLLLAGLAPLAFTGWAYLQRARHPEIVWEAGVATRNLFLGPPVQGTYAPRQASPRLRFTAAGDSYAGFEIREPTADWRPYQVLALAVANPGAAPIRINVRIDDRPRGTEYEDRYNRERTLPPGASVVWRIPMADIEQGPRDRRLDLSHIRRLVIFLSPGSRGDSFELEGVRLERAP